MNKRKKELIVKGSIVITGCLLFTFAIGFPVVCTVLGYQFEDVENGWNVLFFLTVFFGIIMMVLLATIKLPNKVLVPEKFPLLYYSKKSFDLFLEKKLKEKAYHNIGSFIYRGTSELSLYMKLSRPKNINCTAIIRTAEVSKGLLESINDEITHILAMNIDESCINNINMISIFCVDRLGPVLRNLLTSNLHQGLKNGRIVAAISFGSKQIFLARQKDGFAYCKYKRLKKELIEMLELTRKTVDGSVVLTGEDSQT